MEKILITPRVVKYQDKLRLSEIQDTASRAFHEIFKKPPSRLGEARTLRKSNISPRRVGPSTKASTVKVADFLKDDFDDCDDDNKKTKAGVETSWFDNFVDRKNISLDDQIKDQTSTIDVSKYNEPSQEGS